MKSALPPDLWQARYESLRQHVVNGGHTLASPPLGLHLLRCQGVAGWMVRWTQAAEHSNIGVPPPPPSLPAAADWQEQLTLVLAQMTFQQIHPVMTP
jgi:hypothetical protein